MMMKLKVCFVHIEKCSWKLKICLRRNLLHWVREFVVQVLVYQRKQLLLNWRQNLHSNPNNTKLEEFPYNVQEIDACIICYTEFKEQKKIENPLCKHEYHVDCITNWLVIKNEYSLFANQKT